MHAMKSSFLGENDCKNILKRAITFVVFMIIIITAYIVMPSPSQANIFYKQSVNKSQEIRNISTLMTPEYKPLIYWRSLKHSRLIVYNRVPKCGSSTMVALIDKMKVSHNFSYNHSKDFKNRLFLITEQKQMISEITRIGEKKPFLYERHINFLNFTKYGYRMPEYINLIRDPISRYTSAYYYQIQYHHPSRQTTINQCVEQNQTTKPCEKLFLMIPYFCGQEDFCVNPTMKALNRAKQNVDQYYSVVGILEDLHGFLTSLECIFPQYFKNIVRVFKAKKVKKRQSVHKKEISDYNKKRMRNTFPMTLEYHFYNFIKQRFYFLKNTVVNKLCPELI